MFNMVCKQALPAWHQHQSLGQQPMKLLMNCSCCRSAHQKAPLYRLRNSLLPEVHMCAVVQYKSHCPFNLIKNLIQHWKRIVGYQRHASSIASCWINYNDCFIKPKGLGDGVMIQAERDREEAGSWVSCWLWRRRIISGIWNIVLRRSALWW